MFNTQIIPTLDALMIMLAKAQSEIGIRAHPRASENGPEPYEPNVREIGPPHEATNLMISVSIPAIKVCMTSMNGPNT